MKIYSSPIDFAEPDYGNYDLAKEQAREAEHQEQVKAWLLENGYDGPRTGAIYREGIADGYAVYMLAHKGRQSALIHLPYGDSYHGRAAPHMNLTAVLAEIDRQERAAAFFRSKT